MNISAQIRINENMADSTEVASGFVEIEDCIKFPVKVRKYLDKKDNKEKMFVTYPQRKTENGYVDIVTPDKNAREEIETYVLDQMKESLLKNISTSPVTDVKVTLINNEKNLPVPIRGIVSAKVAGVTISGITVKESNKGLFVQMPQYKSNGEYHDTVYGTNKIMQSQIKDAVLYAYNKEQEKLQVQEVAQEQEQTEIIREQSEQVMEEHEQLGELPSVSSEEVQPELEQLSGTESIELFLAAYESDDLEGMIAILENSKLELDGVDFVKNSDLVKSQFASLISDDETDMLTLKFDNSCETPQNQEQKQSVDVYIYKDGTLIGSKNLIERRSNEGMAAENNYADVLGLWKEITHQEQLGLVDAMIPDTKISKSEQSPKI